MSDEQIHDPGPDALTRALEAVGTPPVLTTPLGTFDLVDGVPTPDSASRLYDALDFIRGVDVFLNAVPGASLVAMRNGFRSIGLTEAHQIGYTDPRANSGSFFLTPNTETTYGSMFFDLKKTGPFVIEPPEQSLCVVDDFWFRYVADMGLAGPDQGRGREVPVPASGPRGRGPPGYFVYRPPTYTNWVVFRALGGVPALKETRVYPLAEADDPPAVEFINIAEAHFNTVHANDFSFYEEVNAIVQEEPTTSLDPERTGQLAAIGIVHGRPSSPPTASARSSTTPPARRPPSVGRSSTHRVTPRPPSSRDRRGPTPSSVAATSSCTTVPDSWTPVPPSTTSPRSSLRPWPTPRSVPARPTPTRRWTATGTFSTVAGPTGCRLPPNPPAKNFWAVDIYDTQTRSLLQTDDPYPSVTSLEGTVVADGDGSYTVWFGPEAPAGHESNWIQTVPGKGWFPLLRLYGPLEPWFDKTWQPSEIEPVDGGLSKLQL